MSDEKCRPTDEDGLEPPVLRINEVRRVHFQGEAPEFLWNNKDKPSDNDRLKYAAFLREVATFMSSETLGGLVAMDANFMERVDKSVLAACVAGVFGDESLLRYLVREHREDWERGTGTVPVYTAFIIRLLQKWVPEIIAEFPSSHHENVLALFGGGGIFALTEWFRVGLLWLAWIIQTSITPRPLTQLQKRILEALDSRTLKEVALAAAACPGGSKNRRMLRRRGGLLELMDLGVVKHMSGVGYYRL